MSRRRIALLTIVGLLIATNVALLYRREAPAHESQPPMPTAQQLTLFQDKADKACLCERRTGYSKHDICWADYERSVAPFKPERLATACAFEANNWDFFGADKHGVSNMSVTLQRAQNACTAEEEAKLTKAAPADQQTCG